jgi:hypothetical protein
MKNPVKSSPWGDKEVLYPVDVGPEISGFL